MLFVSFMGASYILFELFVSQNNKCFPETAESFIMRKDIIRFTEIHDHIDTVLWGGFASFDANSMNFLSFFFFFLNNSLLKTDSKQKQNHIG